ncbi:hypothetical protein [Romboutsia timonensis]|uniref:hypothetical protein n=1 Tax=Romboutsia timonensis TaxID=1776391 RepID=UPI0008D91C88|nr:hypothetical protein [Romboutsia timonensis]
MKLDKQDKKILIWGFIIGTILNLFIDKAIDSVIMLGVLYFIHKYVDVNKYTENIEFINKEKYIESLNKIIKFLDIYIIIKIILILVTKMGGFNGVELVLLGQIILIYNEKLQRKYIKSINGVEIEKKKNLLNNKALTGVILIVFIGFTYNYFNKIEFEDNHINSPKYKYELTYDKENKRIVDFSGNGFSMVATENEENTKYFNRYIKDIELLSVIDVLEDYSKDALLFMFVLAFSQFNFKDKNKNKKADSVFFNIFLILALIFSSVAFNTYSIDLEFKVMSNFADYSLY